MKHLNCIWAWLGLAVLCALLLSPVVHAQAVCGAAGALARELSERYDEASSAQGAAPDGRLVRLFVSPAGTWTILIVLPDGRACIAAHGDGWELTPVPARNRSVSS